LNYNIFSKTINSSRTSRGDRLSLIEGRAYLIKYFVKTFYQNIENKSNNLPKVHSSEREIYVNWNLFFGAIIY
jgi:hypothetical protein